MNYQRTHALFEKAYSEYQIQVKDHACLRVLWNNLAKVDDYGKCYRSGHPSRILLKRVQRLGVRHIISLRGGKVLPHNLRERALCSKMGLSYYNVPMSSGRPPSRATLEKLVELYESLDEPFLVHCKTGADRTGLAVGVYHLAMLRSVTKKAKKQLDIRFLHLGLGRKKMLRKFFEFYEKTNPDHIPFKVWLQSNYTKDRFVQYLSCEDR